MKNIINNCTFYLIILLSFSSRVFCQSYDRDAAAEYAELWWNSSSDNYNTDYDYIINNNCANFVSQCIIAGGYNLCEGTDGNGLHVDQYGAITYCDWLHLHLYNFKINDQDNDYARLSDPNEPSWIDKGDVGIFGSSSDYWQHAVFAVTGEDGSNILYNANTYNRHHEPVTHFYGGWPSCDFYHIKDYLSPPDFCFNCIWDEEEDEVGPDCGGPCPPCETADDYANFINPTNNLPEETLAMIEINVDPGNGEISVEPNQYVSFKAGDLIKLKPGFHAKSNSNFKAVTTINNNELTRPCDKLCLPTQYYTFYRPCGYELDLVNIVYYEIDVYQWCWESQGLYLIYSNSGLIDVNTKFCFWDGCEGVDPDCQYLEFGVELKLNSCYQGTEIDYNPWIAVLGECNKFKNENQSYVKDYNYYDKIKSLTDDYLIFPNPHAGIFTIQWNDETITEFTIQVLNMMGKPVYTRQHAQPGKTQVDISNQAKGIYFVKLQAGEKVITEKVVYQ